MKRKKLPSQQTRCLCSGCGQITHYVKHTGALPEHQTLEGERCSRSGEVATNPEILAGWNSKGQVARAYKQNKGSLRKSKSIRTVSGGLPALGRRR